MFESIRSSADEDAMWRYLLGEVSRINKKEKVVNMGGVKINWDDSKKNSGLAFRNLNTNDAFRIQGSKAVYIKVVPGCRALTIELAHNQRGNGDGAMLEVATGKIFPPTSSLVELVDVSVDIKAKKPDIYA